MVTFSTTARSDDVDGGASGFEDHTYYVNGEAVAPDDYALCLAADGDARQTRCRGCGRPIFWRRHVATGITAPVDAEPTNAGNLVLLPNGRYRVLAWYDLQKIRPSGQIRYTSHFATCPRSQHFKTKKPARPAR